MPGKSRRTEIFDKILAGNPALLLTTGPIAPPTLTPDQRIGFCVAVILGLLERLQRKNMKEGLTLKKSLRRLERKFWLKSQFDYACAIEQVVKELGNSPTTRLAQRLQPSALELAEQADILLKHMPSKNKFEDRKRWVTKYGLEPGDAAETDAALVELILHVVHKMSESAIHKRLAQANRFVR